MVSTSRLDVQHVVVEWLPSDASGSDRIFLY